MYLNLPTLTAVFPSSSEFLVKAPLLLPKLTRLRLLDAPTNMLCGLDFDAASGEVVEAYILCGRALRIASGVAGGDTAVVMAAG